MSEELKPCPFCGGEAECHKWWSATISGDYATFCAECGCGTNYFKTEAEAIAAWNARYRCGLTDEDYNILLDELGVSERTCRNIAEPDEMSDDPFTCSECGARGPFGDGIYHIGGCSEIDGNPVFWDSWPVYKYCPHCGAKVIEEKGKGND